MQDWAFGVDLKRGVLVIQVVKSLPQTSAGTKQAMYGYMCINIYI